VNLLDRLDQSSYSRLDEAPLRLQATTDAAGFEHHVARWPLRPEHPATLLRPSILGGCFDRLVLPTAAKMRADLPALGFTPRASTTPLVFLDTETTGLMGSGAFVFVVGIAYLEADELAVEQWTLRGVSAEDRMLAAVFDRLEALGSPLCTFNGSSFDLPLLRKRARVNALDPAPLEAPHLDLLHVARRMWSGRQEDCRLVTLERCYLDVERAGDIDGHLIPDTFWEALRNPDDPANERRLSLVRMHNHGDVLSLAGLIPRLARAIRRPDDPHAALRSARHHLSLGRSDVALERLEPWLEFCDESAAGTGGPHPTELQAIALLGAQLLRRLDRLDGAAGLWRWVCTQFPGDPEASDGLAKYLEHRRKDYAGALSVARRSSLPCEARIARLRRKLGDPDLL
jgi:uncharacterized protein YprB with RNaseH-like and TPR domain